MRIEVRPRLYACITLGLILGLLSVAQSQPPSATPADDQEAPSSSASDFPPFNEVTKGYTKVVNYEDGVAKPSLYTIWRRDKDGQMLAELPRTYLTDKYYFAMTVQSGELRAGLQAGERYVTWRRYDKRLALVEPNIAVRSTGDPESKESVERIFTDSILLDVPIVTLSPARTPVIDMDALLVGQASRFFPGQAFGLNPRLLTIKTAKAFPENVELSFEVPTAGGRLKTFHYSISKIPPNTGYSPREADERIGFFTTSFTDLGKYTRDETEVRYINRWHLEKADPKLKLSPPAKPIEFYIEHTVPKRYRYWVKKGILMWNKAFEKVGIRDAIVVHQQDMNPKITQNHMSKDPEDVRYNFVRWLNNNEGTAIGPSRVDPTTGQILDADIILTDGWIRYFEMQYSKMLPRVAMEGFSPQTIAWLNTHPNWDPRIILSPPAERARLLTHQAELVRQPYGGHPIANQKTTLLGDDEFDGLFGRQSQANGLCLAAEGKGFDLSIMRMTLSMLAAEGSGYVSDEEEDEEEAEVEEDEEDEDEDEDEEDQEKQEQPPGKDVKKEAKGKEDDKGKSEQEAAKKEEEDIQKLDGVPEDFIGPLLADLVAHEVGHTLGLRHNFKASSVYALGDISNKRTNGGPMAGSVMDYLPTNLKMEDGKLIGDVAMTDIGPYDMWAIEYGYSLSKDLKPILQRVAEPELVYGTDEDTYGPDPRARRYDFAQDPLEYAKDQVKLAKYHRENLLEKYVKDGDTWARAREGYDMSLSLQTRAIGMMANWIGGTYINRDKKGDKNGRDPLDVVPVERQREALAWVLENTFTDEAFGLNPNLIRHLSADWFNSMEIYLDSDFPVHDRVMGIQGSTLTMLMRPDTLRLVYDNELRTPADQDILTLPELLGAISDAIWKELETAPAEKASARKPWLSSLRRNLQREHMQRLIDLTLPTAGFTAAYKPISNLAVQRLRIIKAKIDQVLASPENLDPYSLSHLQEAQVRIEKSLEADYIYNVNDLGGGSPSSIFFFKPAEAEVPQP